MNKQLQYTGANWNDHEDTFTQAFYEQNLSQFWRPEEISLNGDLNVWHRLDDTTKLSYARNLLLLTYLDTYQGDLGMPVLSRSLDEKYHQRKAVLNFMAAMENAVHAKSYSNIFMTYMHVEDINALFKWGDDHECIQKIMDEIVSVYRDLDKLNYKKQYETVDELQFSIAQFKTCVASVFLETCLFYSGFYYPLYFYGQGKLMQAGEIINLIIRDESIHGVYVGTIARELYDKFGKKLQKKLKKWTDDLLNRLYEFKTKIVHDIYDSVGLTDDVLRFVRYNANKAYLNLGFDEIFEAEEINPVVLNGLNTATKTQDFFSMKGNGYQKMIADEIKDEDFFFDMQK